jgi:hypothetical protein
MTIKISNDKPDRIEKTGLTRFGLRVTNNDDGFTFTVVVSESGKQLGNAKLSDRDAKAVAQFIIGARA